MCCNAYSLNLHYILTYYFTASLCLVPSFEASMMLKPNSLTSFRAPSSSSSSYFFQNLIQPSLAIAGVKDVKDKISALPIPSNGMQHTNKSLKKSRQVQQLAEEVANLLIEEQGLINEVEKGIRFIYL